MGPADSACSRCVSVIIRPDQATTQALVHSFVMMFAGLGDRINSAAFNYKSILIDIAACNVSCRVHKRLTKQPKILSHQSEMLYDTKGRLQASTSVAILAAHPVYRTKWLQELCLVRVQTSVWGQNLSIPQQFAVNQVPFACVFKVLLKCDFQLPNASFETCSNIHIWLAWGLDLKGDRLLQAQSVWQSSDVRHACLWLSCNIIKGACLRASCLTHKQA